MEVIFKVQGSTIRGARGKIRNLSHHRFWSDYLLQRAVSATGVPKSEKSGTKTPYEDDDTIGGGKIDGSGTMKHVAVSISPSVGWEMQPFPFRNVRLKVCMSYVDPRCPKCQARNVVWQLDCEIV